MEAWVAFTDDVSGRLLSVLIEVIALFFWFNNQKYLAPIASAFVIMFATYHVGDGVINTKEVKAQKSLVKKQEQIITDTLNEIKDKAYPITIQKTLKAMSDIKQVKDDVYSVDTKKWLTIALIFSVFVMVQVGQVMAVIFLRGNTPKVTTVTEPKKVKVTPSNPNEYSPKAVYAQKFIKELKAYLEANNGVSQASLMEQLGEHRNTWNKMQITSVDGKGGVSIDKMQTMKEKLKEI